LVGSYMNPQVAIPLAATGFVSDIALDQLQNKAAKNVLSQIAAGKVQKPRSDVAWRALVEAEVQALQAGQEDYSQSNLPGGLNDSFYVPR